MSNAVEESTGEVISARYPGGPELSRRVWMDRWQPHYPPGPRAGAEGYAAYIEAVHPWARQFVPLRIDVRTLEELARHRA